MALSCQATNCLPALGQAPSGTAWFASTCASTYGTNVDAFDNMEEVASLPTGAIYNCECIHAVDSIDSSVTYGIQTVCDSSGYIFNGTAWVNGAPGAENELTTNSCSASTGTLVADESWCVVQMVSQDTQPLDGQTIQGGATTSTAHHDQRIHSMLALIAVLAGLLVVGRTSIFFG